MQRVCIALVPTLIASVIIFGINSLILTAVTVAACVFFECGYCKLMGREKPIGDFSAVVTGMLLAFNLPATLPWWMAIVGAFIAIVMVKQLFGGLGYNFANPAIVGRIAMAMGFAGAMSNYPHPVRSVDAFSTATPLAVGRKAGSDSYVTLLLGNHGGVLGETCALTILAGRPLPHRHQGHQPHHPRHLSGHRGGAVPGRRPGPHLSAALRRPDAGRLLHGH